MTEGLNQVHLIGQLGADPELRMTQNGHAMLKLRIATTTSYYDKDKKRQERTEWHRVTLWGARGEALAKYLCKGSRVFVEGDLRTSSYEKDGQKHYTTEIHASNILFCGGKSPSSARDVAFSSPSTGYAESANGGFMKPPPVTQVQDDIPF